MSKNEAINQASDKGVDPGGKGRRPEEVLNLMNRSIDFIKELMEENEKLRYRAAQIQEENRELVSGADPSQRARILLDQIQQIEQEKERILSHYQEVEKQNKSFAARYVEIEEENNNLAHLYVCSFQLHSTLDFNEVIQIIMEIIINLIGAEDFGVLLLDEKNQTLRPVAMEGIPIENVEPVPSGKGIIGKAVITGENYYDALLTNDTLRANPNLKRDPDNPLVCIPLKIKERVIGVIVLYKLLPQKTQFANVDYELFTLLAGHAATAIFSAKLYTEAQRKLDTIKGFMGLLTSMESQ